MKRFKIPETGDNVILKSKKTADYKEVKIVEVEEYSSEYFWGQVECQIGFSQQHFWFC